MKVSTEQKSAFRRAAQLLGRTQSQIIHRAIQKAIHDAKAQYGARFECVSIEEELALDALDAGMHELAEIAEHANLSEAKVAAALKSLTQKKLISARLRPSPVRGPHAGRTQHLYFLPDA